MKGEVALKLTAWRHLTNNEADRILGNFSFRVKLDGLYSFPFGKQALCLRDIGGMRLPIVSTLGGRLPRDVLTFGARQRNDDLETPS